MKTNKELMAEIQHALAKEEKLRECLANIYVLVSDGAVILAGSVNSKTLKEVTRAIVGSIPEVNLVMNDLKIEPSRSQPLGVSFGWATTEVHGCQSAYQ
jgi:osmotically-inducible protein OsmY